MQDWSNLTSSFKGRLIFQWQLHLCMNSQCFRSGRNFLLPSVRNTQTRIEKYKKRNSFFQEKNILIWLEHKQRPRNCGKSRLDAKEEEKTFTLFSFCGSSAAWKTKLWRKQDLYKSWIIIRIYISFLPYLDRAPAHKSKWHFHSVSSMQQQVLFILNLQWDRFFLSSSIKESFDRWLRIICG